MEMSNKFVYDVMSVDCDVIVIFPIYGQFGAIRKPDSGRMVCKINIFINSNLLYYENWKQNATLTLLYHIWKKYWDQQN